MVVEDDASIRDMLVRSLGTSYCVYESSDGQTALENLARMKPPDLIIMDVMMPRMDGCAAFRAMRGHLQGDGLPIVLMSAMAEPADLDPEIAAFLRKPVDLEDLLALVARLLMDS